MSVRQKIRMRIARHGNAWVDKVADWQEGQPEGWRTSNTLFYILTPHDSDKAWASKWICRLLFAHGPESDHCGKPEHDYCMHCGMRMPFKGPDVEKRLAHLEKMRATMAALRKTTGD